MSHVDPPPTDGPRLAAVTDEMDHLLYVTGDLRSLANSPILSAPSVALLLERYTRRYATLYAEWQGLTGATVPPDAPTATASGRTPPPNPTGGYWAPPALGRTRGPGPGPPPPPLGPTWSQPQPWTPPQPSEPWLRPFVTDNAILILSYLGGFLLIIATLLFETYGPDLGGLAHLSALVAMDAIFGVSAWGCLRRPALRIIGESYTAVFALLIPLTFVAAYRFLGLDGYGIQVSAATTAGGLACALLYGTVGVRMHSMAYAALAELAFAAGYLALLQTARTQAWTAAWATPLLVLATAIALGPISRGDTGRLFSRPAGVIRHVIAGGAVAVAMGQAVVDGQFPAAPQLTATFVGVTIAYVLASGLARAPMDACLAALAVSVTGVVATQAARLGGGGAGMALTATALAYAVASRRPPTRTPGTAQRAPQFLRAGAVLQVIGVGALTYDGDAARVGFLLAAALVSLMLSLDTGEPGWLLAGGFALLMQLAAVTNQPALLDATPRLVFLPVTLSALTISLAATGVRRRRPGLALPINAGISATALAVAYSTHGNAPAYAAILVVLGGAGAVAAWVTRGTISRDVHRGFVLGAALRLVIAALLPVGSDAGHVAVLLPATALFVAISFIDTEPRWILPAGGLFSWAWYFAVPHLIPTPANPGASDLAVMLTPLPVLYVMLALTVRALAAPERRSTWPAMLEILAAAAGCFTLLVGFTAPATMVASWDTIGFATLVYLVGFIEGWALVVPLAGLGTTVGIFSLLSASTTDGPIMAPIVVGWAWMIYVGHLVFPQTDRAKNWSLLHRYSGITIAGVTALACIGVPAFIGPHATGAVTSFGVAVSFAMMLVMDGRLNRVAALDYAGAGVAAISTLWLAGYAGIGDADVVMASILATTILVMALVARHDHRVSVSNEVRDAALVMGSAALLGSSLIHAIGADTNFAGFTTLLLLEGISLVLLGIGERLRLLVLAGSAGAASAALRALYQAVATIPLWSVFGATALLLLAVAGWLAGHRSEITTARSVVRAEWQRWE